MHCRHSLLCRLSVNRCSCKRFHSGLALALSSHPEVRAMISIGVPTAEKYFRVYRQTKPGDSEKKLMFAVLVDAIRTYQKFAFSTSVRRRARFREEAAWFSNEQSDRVFSFANICQVFGLDPQLFRRELRRQLMMDRRGGTALARAVHVRDAGNRTRKLTLSEPARVACFTSERSAVSPDRKTNRAVYLRSRSIRKDLCRW